MESKITRHFVIENRIGELSALAGKIEALTKNWELGEAMAMNLSLVLEEAVSNIINYAFRDDHVHKIRISVTWDAEVLTLRIRDDGVPFDPTAVRLPDVSQPAGERPIGGLGILLISKLMDHMKYSRINNENVLTLIKHT